MTVPTHDSYEATHGVLTVALEQATFATLTPPPPEVLEDVRRRAALIDDGFSPSQFNDLQPLG